MCAGHIKEVRDRNEYPGPSVPQQGHCQAERAVEPSELTPETPQRRGRLSAGTDRGAGDPLLRRHQLHGPQVHEPHEPPAHIHICGLGTVARD